jgi:hypothetical protein
MRIAYEDEIMGTDYPDEKGVSRQVALAKMAKWREVCQGRLFEEVFEGKPALAVKWTVVAGRPCKDGDSLLGYVRARDVDRLLARMAPFATEGRPVTALATVLFSNIQPNRKGILQCQIRVVVPSEQP